MEEEEEKVRRKQKTSLNVDWKQKYHFPGIHCFFKCILKTKKVFKWKQKTSLNVY